jgi:hypothetical protein
VWILTWLLVLAAGWWRVDRIGLDHFQSIALAWGILFPALLFAVFVVGMWVLEGFRASASSRRAWAGKRVESNLISHKFACREHSRSPIESYPQPNFLQRFLMVDVR